MLIRRQRGEFKEMLLAIISASVVVYMKLKSNSIDDYIHKNEMI